ncbi:ribosome biogenesis GTPase YlqF [Peptoniphilus sp. oral taxon 386]|uniref:ribosome biogenesis GTPase YlqF n=1 Tax=Peptoniphilus sp. oral taxon 386 TaxID=652713 RepID=UPI0001DA9CA9|nr:ribosome biogenesis GTPase YlqF [Peptoniphilus sp. oral taxon 386]EFI42457.1 ribosome biogenesis GTP-binding protein YlqF [Peptoniphilus sp. oral taxon 386 str. F0131]
MNINWYPGHMKKTIEDIEAKTKLVDFYIEIIDSRIPISSRNPLLNKVLSNKKGLLVLNKSDLSEESQNRKWAEKLSTDNKKAILYSAAKPNVNKIINESMNLMAAEIEKSKEKGINMGPLRAMIVGIPNSGKSTFINGISKRKSAKTGNRPGVTKTNQWIKLNPKIHLLDTPGVLWPKFEDQNIALNLAFTGAIKDEIMDTETLCLKLIERLLGLDSSILEDRYKVTTAEKTPVEIMEAIGMIRGAKLRGNEIDYTKVSNLILDEFRKGVLGRITLERA